MIKEIKEKYVHMIEDAGISLIKNAESIIGDYKYRVDQPMELIIRISDDNIPTISFNTEFVSERINYKRP
jgi:hypothetical protein